MGQKFGFYSFVGARKQQIYTKSVASLQQNKINKKKIEQSLLVPGDEFKSLKIDICKQFGPFSKFQEVDSEKRTKNDQF